METTYRLTTRTDESVSEVVAENLTAAVEKAEDMGYKVIDTVHPDQVLVEVDTGHGPILQVTIKANGQGEVFSNGRISPAQAADILRTIADGLAGGGGNFTMGPN